MKIKLLIIIVFCLFVFNILLLNINYKQKEIIKNDILHIAAQDEKLFIKNDSLRNKISYIYHNNVSRISKDVNIYNTQKKKLLATEFLINKLIIIIPETRCTSCFYHAYEEMAKSLDPSLKSKICMIKSVKEISRAVLDDTAGVEFYIENGFGLEIEKHNIPYILYMDKYREIKYTFLFDIKHPSTFLNAINFIIMKQNGNS